MADPIGAARVELSAGHAAFGRDMGKAAAHVKANATAMERAMAKVGRSFSGVTGSIKTLKKKYKDWHAVVSALAIGAAFRAVINATKEEEQAIAQLEQTLKSTGRYTPELASQMKNYAAELQKVTTYGDETVIAMQALLLTFTKIGGDEFNRAQKVTLDVATALKTDLKSAALQVGKALNDPVLGMTALSRSGIQFSEAQKDVVKKLVATGDVVGAQKIVLKELETQFGGSAEAARNTLGGALTALKNAFGDLLEGDFGGGGVKGTTKAINDLTDLLADPEIVKNAKALTNAMITGFGKVLKAISTTVEFTTWLSDELAAQIYGVAGDDIIRLEQKLESLKAKLEVPLDIPLDSLPWADEVQKEIDKVQKQIDDFYASAGTKTVKPPKATIIPVVPVVTGGAGIVEETPEAKAAREKAEKDAEAVHKLRVETYLKDESDKWAALEEYEKEFAEKQAEFADAHKQATLSDVEYELSKLQEQYDAYGTYIDDKVALDEWYAASKKKILDKQKDDETKMIAELKAAIEGWGKDSADAIVEFARTGEMTFENMINSMIDDLLRMMIYQNITGPLFGSISGGMKSFFGSAHGNVFQGGNLVPFARGGIVTQPTIFPMARGAGLMGEAGAEAVMPLTRIGGDLGVRATGGGVEVNIINNVGADVSTSERTTADGQRALDVYIDQAVAKKLGQFGSQSNKAMRANYGARPQLTGR